MTAGSEPIAPAQLRRGERVQAWAGPMMEYVGVVDLVDPGLAVAWIRDLALGERKMLDLRRYRLYRDRPGSARSR